MATQGEQGTGKHPHKKTSEPFEHHGKSGEGASTSRGASGSGKEEGGSRSSSRGGEEERRGGSQAKGGSQERSGQGGAGGQQGRGGGKGGGEDAELKSREYTDADGNVHHHTKTYMEQHKGK